MGRFQPGSAELDFLNTLRGGLDKEAVDLAPETRQLLGIERDTPDDLDRIEESAAEESQPASKSLPAQAQPAPQPPQAQGQPVPQEAQAQAQAPEEAEDTQAVSQAAPAQPEAVDIEAPPPEDAEPQPDEGEEAPPAPPLPDRISHGKIFGFRRTHPLQLLQVLNQRYKQAWIDWEPDTLWWAIRKDFGPVGDVTRNKIQALRLALSSNRPWQDWDAFEKCSLSWNDQIPIFGAYQPMTPSQTAFGVHILKELQPELEFSNEVKAYIAAVLEEAGIVYAPEEWFDGAQDLIDRKAWLTGFKLHVNQVWDKARSVNPDQIDWREDDPVDIHVAKLMVVREYLMQREALLQAPVTMPTAEAVQASQPVP